MIVFVGLILLFLGLSSIVIAQEAEENYVENIANSSLEEEQIHEGLIEHQEYLEELRRKPINLNQVDRASLQKIPFLSFYQIEQFLRHRELAGDFISIYELQAIAGFDIETVEMLLPLVTINESTRLIPPSSSISKGKGYIMSSIARQLEIKRGFQISDTLRSRYLGDPNRILVRIRHKIQNRYYLSINAKKDPGEPFFNRKQRYGFDYYSGSLLAKDVGRMEKLVIGDYNLQFGQGLTLWSGGQFTRGNAVLQTTSLGAGIRQHTGMRESGYFRGIALTTKFRRTKLTPFVSYNALTGNLASREGATVITGFNASGLHRTAYELRNRRAVKQRVYGLNAEYDKSRLKMGITYLGTDFKHDVSPSQQAYNEYRFKGRHLRQLGIYGQYTSLNTFFYGETAHSINTGWAHMMGSVVSLGKKFSVGINYRNYQSNYHQFYAEGYGRLSTLGNERGVYFALRYHPSRSWDLSTAIDFHKFPDLRYRARLPSQGSLFYSQIQRIWYKRGAIALRYQHREYEENYLAKFKVYDELAKVKKDQIRINFHYKISTNWEIANRVEFTHFSKSMEHKQNGVLAYQDFQWQDVEKRWKASVRMIYFDIDSYNARIYSFERDMLYSLSFPFYYHRGARLYINQRVKLNKKWAIWAKVGWTRYFDQDSYGSALI
ncbi:hypothetical protein GQF61_11445 [Sphingobacterium sp. DK4209]|uniref:Helix-hairpin-helix domain-containing protein n=1 Tax=Sphingobacterium zhuxiongii TaxID=2662364 RepID=A0A5Q0QEE6_9SPHI|nr:MULTISPECIES: helix-hairpin-helix domain-containing protein [unclassified Sphingobacterium]MVZ66474.1 hypothetical protein [Sphingobacterium sp. DK4209]QGA27321.1 hypothetical protein GFH32_13815 [Sphingobacterium sp. dk4302]